MTIINSFAVYLIGAGRQQVLQGAKAVLNPVAPLLCPDEPQPADVSLQTEQVVQLHTGLMNDDDGHRRTNAGVNELDKSLFSPGE
jgi:hypothetical protein